MFKNFTLGKKLTGGFALLLFFLILISFLAWKALVDANSYADRQNSQNEIVINAENLERQVYSIRYQAMRGIYCKDVLADDPKNPAEDTYRFYLETRAAGICEEALETIKKIRDALDPETQGKDIESCDNAKNGFERYNVITTNWANLQDQILASAAQRVIQADAIQSAVLRILERDEDLITRDHKIIEENGEALKDDDGKIIQYVPSRLVGRQKRLAYVLERIEMLRRLTREQITISNKADMDVKEQQIADAFADLDRRIKILREEFTTAASEKDAITAEEKFKEWKTEIDRYKEYVRQQSMIFDEMAVIARTIVSDTDAVLVASMAAATKAGEDFDGNNSFATTVMLGLGVIAVVIGIALAWGLTKNIAGATRKITDTLGLVVNEGDITVQVDHELLDRGDEVGTLSKTVEHIIGDYVGVSGLAQKLADGDWTVQPKIKSEKDDMNLNLKAMIDKVKGALGSVAEATTQVSTGAREIASASETLANGATESAASIEEITASMSEIGSQINTNAQNANEARQLSKQASEAGATGQEMMSKMITAMEQITKNSQDVKNVIKVINDISFQTNLLALNAAVEAARAGVHGKGFAVVAEEVRNLASRSAKAADETTLMIEGNTKQIGEGAEIATETAEMLNRIVEHSTQTSELIEKIATASNEQAQGVAQITQGLQQIDAVTQQNTASAEETASVSNEMNSQSTNLQQLIGFFRLQ